MINLINRLLTKSWMPLGLKLISLTVFIVLVVNGFTAVPTSDNLMIIRNTNLGNLIVWSYWWPIIIILSILFGRLWCMICPVELVTSFCAKIGLQRKRPQWILSGWGIILFYAVVVFIGLQGFAIHRNPSYMSIYMLTIMGVSVLSGLVYEKNTFCRYICPVGYLLALYSLLSSFGWGVKRPKVCETCKDKSCVNKKYRYNFNAKSCAVDHNPSKVDESHNCILCTGCVKTCDRYQTAVSAERPNPGFQYRGFANGLFKMKTLQLSAMLFVLIDTGIVMKELFIEWKPTRAALYSIPKSVVADLSIDNKFVSGALIGLIIFVIFPFLLWLIPWLSSRLMRSGLKFKDYMLNYALAFIPISAMVHFSKCLVKMSSRFPYFEHLSKDYTGTSTAEQIIDKSLLLTPLPAWVGILLSVIITLLISIGVWTSFRVVNHLNRKYNGGWSTYLIPIIYGFMFVLMILGWRWL